MGNFTIQISDLSSEFCEKWDFENMNFAKKWDFEIVNIVKRRLNFWKCDFVKITIFENVNLAQNEILKMWI